MSRNAILDTFFATYADFEYNPRGSPTGEFYRLCDKFCLKKGDASWEEVHEEFQTALTQQFNKNFGTKLEDVKAWKKLCRRLGIDPVPDKLKECRRIVDVTHVNLVDVVGTGKVQKFPTVDALSEYTKRTGKFFPRDNIEAGELLVHLLRHIMDPALDARRNQNQGAVVGGRGGGGGGRRGAKRGRGTAGRKRGSGKEGKRS